MKPKITPDKSEDEDLCNKNNNYFGCAFCNYSSDKSANLNRHVRSMHEVVKETLVCCGLQFKSKSDYREHNKGSHKEGHLCTVCTKSFSRRALLKRHQSVHTGIKDFKCDYCTYSSSHKSNVVRHLKIHREIIGLINSRRYFQPEPDSTTTTTATAAATATASMSSLLVNASAMTTVTRTTAAAAGTVGEERSSKTEYKTNHNINNISGISSNVYANEMTSGKEFSSANPTLTTTVVVAPTATKKSHILLSVLKSSKDDEQGTKKIKHSIDSILKKTKNERNVAIKTETLDTEPVSSSSTWADERHCTFEQGTGSRFSMMEPYFMTSCIGSTFTTTAPYISSTSNLSDAKEIKFKLPTPAMTLTDLPLVPDNANGTLSEPNYFTFPTRPSSYLPAIDFNGFPGTNWTSLPLPPVSPYSVYPFRPGYGSIMGHEESRFLSSPHSQTSLGLPMTSAFSRPYERIRVRDLAKFMPYPSPHLFSSPVVMPPPPPPPPSSASSSSSPQSLSAAGSSLEVPRKSSHTPHLWPSTVPSPGVMMSNKSSSGSCLTFTEVSNSQVTQFVTY